MKRIVKTVITSMAVLVLLGMLCVCAAAEPAVPDVDAAIPGLSATAVAAGTGSP